MGNQQGKHQHHQSGKPKKMVHWKSAERPSPPGRPILVPLSEEQPDVVNLHWEKPKIDGGSPITGYIVEHRRMGSPHWVRATPTPVSQCEVSISGLEPGWRYQFRAFAENVVGRSDPSELSDPLTVTLQRNAISVPRFTDELQDMHAVEDERIEFRVRTLGQPPPEINWFKDGYEIFSSRRTKIINDNDVSVLIIHQVALSDEGEIKCTATNRAGHVVTKAKLLVQAPPKIRLPRTYEDGLIIEAGEVLRLKVGIAGQPPPLVTWQHEGEIIPTAGRFEIVTTDRNSMLKIDNVQRDDRGEYSIRAANKLGEDVTSFLVTVTARPNPPGKVRLNMSFGKSATLSWTAPLDDGGCKIGNYIVEYFRVGWNVWLKATTTRSLTTTLNDLFEGSEYKFRVKAENPYGVSDPSEESDVLFIPDPKRGITKPKSAAKLPTDDPSKPVPPRRKTLSPPRVDAATETPRLSPLLQRKAKPQLLDNEDLHREMSYGTPDQVLKMDLRKSPSQSSADSSALNAKAKLQHKIETPPTPMTPNSPDANKPPTVNVFAESLRAQLQPNKAAVPAQAKREIAVERPAKLQPPLATPERSTTPDMQTGSAAAKSPSAGRKAAPATAATAGKAQTPPEQITGTPALQRSAEPAQLGGNQHVRRYSGHSMSPIKNASALAIAIATGLNINEGNGFTRQPQEAGKDTARATNGNGYANGRATLGNPIIQISAPAPAPTPTPASAPVNHTQPAPVPRTPSPPPTSLPRVVVDKHDDVHTSNEFMLVVFDKHSKVKDKDKQDSFELDLEDALQPPPISISSPDLASLEYTNLQPFPLRRSVSSTELLYERAMARFYEAVELEEAEKARKLKAAQDKASGVAQQHAAAPTSMMRKRLGSMTEAERLSFEWRSEQRRQSTDIVQEMKLTQTKWSSRENIASMKPLSRTTGQLLNERQPSQDSEEQGSAYETQSAPNKEESFELGSDYTESTASSDEDSIEKFKMELMARTRSPSPRDLDTYHPRDMNAGIFTPYRAPTPDEAALVLNRPMPLPSPDFVPKPILKRPSIENVKLSDNTNGNGNGNANAPAATQQARPVPQASANDSTSNNNNKLDIAKGIKSFFKRDKRTATERNTAENQQIADKSNAAALAAELEAKRKAKEAEEELKRKEAERQMLEEAHAAVDHYSDLVQQISATHKYHKPIYLDHDELKKVAEQAAKEADSELENAPPKRESPDRELRPPVSNRPRLSISERGQMQHVRQTASELALKERKQPDTPTSDQSEQLYGSQTPAEAPELDYTASTSTEQIISETHVENPDGRGRTRIVKVKRIIKRRVPSSSARSRDASLSRPPSSLAGAIAPLHASFEQLPANDDKHLMAIRASEQLSDEAQENVRSALSYSTDLVLFVVACYVYLFKDARLVLPILALMIYRQLGEVINAYLPSWMKRKRNN